MKFLKRNMGTENGTSLLVTAPAILLWFFCFLLSLFFQALIPSALFLVLFLFGILVRAWAAIAVQQVDLLLNCPEPWVFPGQEIVLSYKISNQKSFPLFWLEVNQNGPEHDFLLPDEHFEAYHEAGTSHEIPAYLRQNFSYTNAWNIKKTETIWHAKNRGFYPITHMSARTGDGFGLVQRSVQLPSHSLPCLAVFPRTVDVDLSLFLSMQWNTQTNQRGYMEDQTVLRGNREYTPGDNWKHINWRMAAREQGLPINLFQSIQPQIIHFILDGESFYRQPEELERMLSILSSVLSGLDNLRIQVILSLSQSKNFSAITLFADQESGVRGMLYYLAGFECMTRVTFDESIIPESVFPEDISSASGRLWLITYSGQHLPFSLLQKFNPESIRILCMEDFEIPSRAGYQAHSLNTIQKEEIPYE